MKLSSSHDTVEQLDALGDEERRADQHDADDHLRGPRAADRQQQAVDQVIDERDVDERRGDRATVSPSRKLLERRGHGRDTQRAGESCSRPRAYYLLYTAGAAGARQRCGRAARVRRAHRRERRRATVAASSALARRPCVHSRAPASREEPLAARADDDRPTEPRAEVAGMPEQLEVGLRVGALAEAEARVDPGRARGPRRSAASRSAELGRDLAPADGAPSAGEHLGERAAAQVAGDVGRAGRPTRPAIAGSNRPPETSLTIVARRPRPPPRATAAFVVSIETVAPAAASRLDHREHPAQLLGGVDGVGARVGRLAADVERSRRPSRGELRGRARSRPPGRGSAAVGERVGRDVDDAHHERRRAA